MKTTPLLTLAVTVIASVLLNSCSLISSRHYNLNLVKVQKNKLEQQKPKQVINEISELNSFASTENSFIPNLTFKEEKGADEIKQKQTDVKELKFKNLNSIKALKNSQSNPIKPKSSREYEVGIDPYASFSFLSGLLSIILPYIGASQFHFAATDTLSLLFILSGPILGITALITGLIGINHINNGRSKGYGYAIVGVTVGIIYLALFLLIFGIGFMYFGLK